VNRKKEKRGRRLGLVGTGLILRDWVVPRRAKEPGLRFLIKDRFGFACEGEVGMDLVKLTCEFGKERVSNAWEHTLWFGITERNFS